MMERSIKTCSKCKKTQDIKDFHRNRNEADGHQYWCKRCCRQHAQSPHYKEIVRKAQQRFRQTDKYQELTKRFLQSPKGITYKSAKMKRYREKYPEREAARYAIRKAIRNNILPQQKTLSCSMKYLGDCSGRIEYHHIHGYAPEHYLDVEPICRKHHSDFNKKVYSGTT